MRDSFLTKSYKSGWIHTCYNRTQQKTIVRAQLSDYTSVEVTSIRAAKIRITRSETINAM